MGALLTSPTHNILSCIIYHPPRHNQSALVDANTAHVALDVWLAERATAAAAAEEEEKAREAADKARGASDGNGGSSYSSSSSGGSSSGSNDEDMKVHPALAPGDPCSAKMLSLVSEAAALDDTLYSLDQGLQAQAIPLELFLKQVCVCNRVRVRGCEIVNEMVCDCVPDCNEHNGVGMNIVHGVCAQCSLYFLVAFYLLWLSSE